MPRTNRVDPYGDIHAAPERGLFTGNRGCLVDDTGAVRRRHATNLWITCVLTYRDWSHPLDARGTWTPLFFLDDAVALAAGHRPCGLCRRDAYQAYKRAVDGATKGSVSNASAINAELHTQRAAVGRGLVRAEGRSTWKSDAETLPTGTVIVHDGRPHLFADDAIRAFSFGGWLQPTMLGRGSVDVLTPRLSVQAMQRGFVPTLHPTATD